jgi:hypothetical protein
MKCCHDFISFCNICLNFGTGDVHKVLPIGFEFHKNRHNEIYTLLRTINEYLLQVTHLFQIGMELGT